jgi:hypothetical protein
MNSVKIRRIKFPTGSRKRAMVAAEQIIERKPSNPMAILNGFTNTTTATIVVNVLPETLKAAGLEKDAAWESGKGPKLASLFSDDVLKGRQLNIQVFEDLTLESWERDGETFTRDGKKNPTTDEHIMHNGEWVARHSKLVFGTAQPIMPEGVDANDVEVVGHHTFILHNGKGAAAPEPVAVAQEGDDLPF